MNSQPTVDPADFIVPLEINGMTGRMLHLKAPKNYPSQEFLVVYDRHASIERWWKLAQNYNRYGAVTMPDLPGFGGMDSFYAIGKKPDLDSMADYLASFVKWRYKRKKVKIIGIAYGFLVVTRMLQRYPDLVKKVELVICIGGYAHHEDLAVPKNKLRQYRYGTRILSVLPVAFLFRHVALNSRVIRQAYQRQSADNQHNSSPNLPEIEKQITIWQRNDVRTRWKTAHDMLTVDNCQKQVPVDVWRITTHIDQHVSMHHVEQHLQVIYSAYHDAPNAGSFKQAKKKIADPDEVIATIPASLKRLLASSKKL